MYIGSLQLTQSLPSSSLCVQLRHDKVLFSQIQQESAEKNFKNKEALDIVKRISLQKQKDKDSIIDELVIIG